MKRVIRFNRFYIPAVILSSTIIVFGLIGYFTKGFNLGVDFQAGINQTVQLAFPSMRVSYAGKGNVTLNATETAVTVVFSGSEIENRTVVIDYAANPTLGTVAAALAALPEFTATVESGEESRASTLMVPTAQANTRVGTSAMVLHRAPESEAEHFATIEGVRQAITGAGEISVQQVNPASLQRYLVRLQDEGKDPNFARTAPELIRKSLEAKFGADRVVALKTDFVGATYSQSLTRQSGLLILATIIVIMLYAGIRFKFQYGFGAVLAIVHDALVMVSFIVWTRMEFNASSIAAILTILGFSINDTIVQFDRVREERKLRPTENFKDVIDSALTITLGRTIITTAATMMTVLALFFFTSGSLKGFALALFVGMVSGTYSTIYIASAFVLGWDNWMERRNARKRLHAPAVAKPAAASASKAKEGSSK